MLEAPNRLVYLDWPDLRDVTHIPARGMQQMSQRSHHCDKKPRQDPYEHMLQGTREIVLGNWRIPHEESPLGTFLKIPLSLPKITHVKI